ncbi:hypothetical protein ACWA1F_05455 [Flavobacterium sp. 3-218]
MYGISPFVLLLIPLLIQIIWGTKAINKTTNLKFVPISITTVLLQIPLSFLSVYIASENLNANPEFQTRCGLIMLPIVSANFLAGLLLLLTIVVQFFIKRFRDKKLEQ